MCLLKIRCLLLIICKCLVITTSYAAVERSVPPSPCPSVLDYEFDNNNKLLGYIAAAPPTSFSDVITLDVQYTVGNEVQDDAKLELMSSRSTIAEDVRNNKLLSYKLEFPRWQNIPPQITKIVMNENQICYGQPLDIPGIRTVKLQHRQSLISLPVPLNIRPDNEESVQHVGYDDTSKTKPKPVNSWINPQAPTDPGTEVNSQKPQSTFSIFGNDDTRINYPLNPQAPSNTNPNFNQNNDPTPFYPRPFVDDLGIWQPSTSTSNPIKNPFWKVCGQSTNTVQLIINGKKVQEGEHPWVAALFVQDDKGLKFICGSTLISERHVVTAAHCVTITNTKAEDFWIILGKKNIKNWSNDGAQVIEAESTHPHPEYKQGTGHADIAVIRLHNKVIFTNLIKPICLWTGNPNYKLIVQKKGTVVGWGKDENEKQYTAEPSKLTIPVVTEEDCLRSNMIFNGITSGLTFCAGYRNNSGPCTGDSGSGFFMKQNGRWTLRGVVSTALADDDNSCDVNEYIVFADAAAVTEWLFTFLN